MSQSGSVVSNTIQLVCVCFVCYDRVLLHMCEFQIILTLLTIRLRTSVKMTSKRNDIIERYRVLPGQIQSIDKDVKNTWKWSWLETEVDGIMLA